MRKTIKSHNWLIGAGFAALGLIVAWTTLWLVAARQAGGALEDWILRQRAMGDDWQYQMAPASGYPAWVTLRLRDVAGVRRGVYTLQAPQLTLSLRPWNWLRYRLAFAAPAQLTLPWEGREATIQFHADAGIGRIALASDGRWTTLRWHLEQPSIGIAGQAPWLRAAVLDLDMSQPETPPASFQDVGMTTILAARNITLPPGLPRGLPPSLATLGWDADVLGPVPDPRQTTQLETWRSQGGTLQLKQLGLVWDTLALNATGTLALDKTLQPEGALTSTIKGWQEFVTSVQSHGGLEPLQASLLRGALGLLAKPDDNKQLVIQAPLTLQNRILMIGMFPVATFPAIDWGTQ